MMGSTLKVKMNLDRVLDRAGWTVIILSWLYFGIRLLAFALRHRP